MINIDFDLSEIPEFTHAVVKARLAEVIPACQKYADCTSNGRMHLALVVLPATEQAIASGILSHIDDEDLIAWLNSGPTDKPKYAGWCLDRNVRWANTTRRVTDQILDHYRYVITTET